MDFQLMLENAQDENERKDLIMLEAWDVAVKKANLSLDTYNKLQELERRGRQVKYFAENVSEDTDKLTAFYEEESALYTKNAEKKRGLIKRAWEAIKKWWKEMKARIRSYISKVKLNKEISDESTGQISRDALTLPEKISKMTDQAKVFLSNHKKESVIALITSIIAVSTTIVAVNHMRNPVKITGKQFKKHVDDVNTATDKIESAIDNLSKAEEQSTKLSAEDISKYREMVYSTTPPQADYKGYVSSIWDVTISDAEATRSTLAEMGALKRIDDSAYDVYVDLRRYLSSTLGQITDYTRDLAKAFTMNSQTKFVQFGTPMEAPLAYDSFND